MPITIVAIRIISTCATIPTNPNTAEPSSPSISLPDYE